MKTKKTRFGENAENQKEFQRFLEAAGIKSWTPYSNDTLRAQMSASQKPRSRVFAWLILNSWGLAVKSAFAKCGNRAARYVDIASELELDEKHVRKLVLQLEARGWLRLEDKRIYPESHPVLKEIPEELEEESFDAARERFLSVAHPEVIAERIHAHSVWNDYRKHERAAFNEFDALSEEAKRELAHDAEEAKNTPVQPKEPVVQASEIGGTGSSILTGFKKEETSLSRVAGVNTPALHPESITTPASHSEVESVSRIPPPPAAASHPDPSASQSASQDVRKHPPASPLAPNDAVYKALACYGPTDRETAKTLLDKCRRISPDATGEEVAELIHHRGKDAARRKRQNPVGHLITYLPRAFPDALEELRQARAAEPPPELGPTLEKLIETALIWSEGGMWADHPDRSEMTADVAQYEKDDPELVALIRARLKERGWEPS